MKTQGPSKGRRSLQARVEDFFSRVFGRWGEVLADHTGKVFAISTLVFILLSAGMSQSEMFENEQIVWTPRGNKSILNSKRASEMFPAQGGYIGLIGEPREAEASVVSVAALSNLDDLLGIIFETTTTTNEGKELSFSDVCIQVRGKCFVGENPTSFAETPQGIVDFEQFITDADLLAAVQSGKGGSAQGNGNFIEVAPMFGGTDPEEVTQDAVSGSNNLQSAKVFLMGLPYERRNGITKDQAEEIELAVQTAVEAFNADEARSITVSLFSQALLGEAFSGDVSEDLKWVQVSVALVALYCIFFMGSCSPIHFRSTAAIITLVCVALSYAASSGFSSILGFKSAGIHSLLPFLLIGIGVDNMFVISSQLDQADPLLPVRVRMRQGMIHAGSSITITSFTNVIAFLLGCSSNLDALQSFSFFAGMGIVFLYISSLTIYSSFMVWDLQRQVAQRGDCCGFCTCKEDSALCCSGKFLTPKQKAFPFQGTSKDPQPSETQYSNGTQKFLHQTYSPLITSKQGIVVVLITWAILIALAIVGISKLEVDFKTTYFIGETAKVRSYFDLQDEFFKAGDAITFYVDSSETDFSSTEVQAKINTLNAKILECEGCSQPWLIEDSFDSWFVGYKAFAQQATIDSASACSGAWEAEKETVAPGTFYPCLEEFLASRQGSSYRADLLFNEAKDKIVGFRQDIKSIYVNSAAKEGVDLLLELRAITEKHGIGNTFSYAQAYYDYEGYITFAEDAALNIGLAMVAVFVVLIVVTASVPMTLFVLFCVGLVDLFLFGLLGFWEVTLNSVTVVNIVIAIGLAVDYSAHIGHSYLTISPPEKNGQEQPMTNFEKRAFKARGALSVMGSSVFHGSFSTFLAIVVLAPSASYIFQAFFKMWFGIIIFGVANGFILLPVMLTLCGPLSENSPAHSPTPGSLVNEDGKYAKVNSVKDVTPDQKDIEIAGIGAS